MTLDEILHGLFPDGHHVKTSKDGWITGNGKRRGGEPIAVVGVANGVPLDAAGACCNWARTCWAWWKRAATPRSWCWWIRKGS